MGLVFPADLGSEQNSKAMLFTFYEYSKEATEDIEVGVPTMSLALPLPAQLVNQDGLDYQGFDAGIEYGFYKSVHGAMAAAGGDMDYMGAAAMVASDVASATVGGKGPELAAAIGSAMANQVLSDGASTVDVLTGRTLNPRQLSKFDHVYYRTYTFTFAMTAKNEEESRAIRDIVKQFRLRSHPDSDRNDLFLNFPELVQFRFSPNQLNDYLWISNPCAITNINMEYQSQSTPKFFESTQAPVEHILTLQLKEMTFDTRQSLEEKYNEAT